MMHNKITEGYMPFMGYQTYYRIVGIEPEGLHIGHLRCHQATEISYQFCLYTSGEGQFLTHSFGSCL